MKTYAFDRRKVYTLAKTLLPSWQREWAEYDGNSARSRVAITAGNTTFYIGLLQQANKMRTGIGPDYGGRSGPFDDGILQFHC